VDKKIKPCDCEHCDFREVVFSTLDDQSIMELCQYKEEHVYRKGEIINQNERITDLNILKPDLLNCIKDLHREDRLLPLHF
jgi:hypothetical protein